MYFTFSLTAAYKNYNDIKRKSTGAAPPKKLSCFQQIDVVWKIKLQQSRNMLNCQVVTAAVLIMQEEEVNQMALLMTISLINMTLFLILWILILSMLLMNLRSISILNLNLFNKKKGNKKRSDQTFFSIGSIIPWIASGKLKVKLTGSFSQIFSDRNTLIPRKLRRLLFELVIRERLFVLK